MSREYGPLPFEQYRAMRVRYVENDIRSLARKMAGMRDGPTAEQLAKMAELKERLTVARSDADFRTHLDQGQPPGL